jgi:hypothetical protein
MSLPGFTAAGPGRWWRRAALLIALLPGVGSAEAQLPPRDLLIELREADAGPKPAGAAGWNLRSADAGAARQRQAQQLRARNGASASLSLAVTRPLQVWQPLPGALLPVAVPATQWLVAGQRLTLQPRWPGGREPVSVELIAGSSHFDATVASGSTEIPQRTESQLATTVLAPLGQWVTLAAAGQGDDDMNVVSSGQAAPAAQRVLQLRVSLLP